MNTRVLAITGLLLMLDSPGAHAFSDADIIALEVSGQLLAPPTLVTQVASDLAAIRQHDAHLSVIHMRPDWSPGEIVVTVSVDAWQLFLAGQYHSLDALNSQHGPAQVEIESASLRELHLTFSQAYNPALLVPIYAGADGVQRTRAIPMAGDGADIVASRVGSYTFKQGWGDCTALCPRAHYWEYAVTGGVVQLMSEYGDEFGACCIFDGPCFQYSLEQCEDQNGYFVGGPCDPNPCALAAEPIGWGGVKSWYR